MTSPLRVAIAGLGIGEKVHLPALRACAGTTPVALWHPRPERLEAACRSAEADDRRHADRRCAKSNRYAPDARWTSASLGIAGVQWRPH